MNSSLIGKIEKAKRYAEERDRIHFTDLSVSFHGEHSDYTVECDDGNWRCSCNFFAGWGTCSHTMALQRILGNMAPKPSSAQQPVGAASE
ncbi:MAG: hypothetical protein EPO21_07865 [Chloroflexota bacterium]|nr:MAG: hypothetical protein EPO21_07865 [Chloroflexota bacterium]